MAFTLRQSAVGANGLPLPPCTHCGDCCRAELCHVAEEMGIGGPPCAMLTEENLCELAIQAGRLGLYCGELAIGLGCTNEEKVGLIQVQH